MCCCCCCCSQFVVLAPWWSEANTHAPTRIASWTHLHTITPRTRGYSAPTDSNTYPVLEQLNVKGGSTVINTGRHRNYIYTSIHTSNITRASTPDESNKIQIKNRNLAINVPRWYITVYIQWLMYTNIKHTIHIRLSLAWTDIAGYLMSKTKSHICLVWHNRQALWPVCTVVMRMRGIRSHHPKTTSPHGVIWLGGWDEVVLGMGWCEAVFTTRSPTPECNHPTARQVLGRLEWGVPPALNAGSSQQNIINSPGLS